MSVQESQYDDIDMKSNYDRELARLVSAEAEIKLGLHRKDANFILQFIANQKYYIKTAYRVAKEHYRFDENEKLFGLVGQGMAWSGPGWLVSSNTIARCIQKSCEGMVF